MVPRSGFSSHLFIAVKNLTDSRLNLAKRNKDELGQNLWQEGQTGMMSETSDRDLQMNIPKRVTAETVAFYPKLHYYN